MVLDLSPSGLFLQTSAKLGPGDRVELELRLPSEKEPLGIVAEVARRKIVPARLLTVAQGGVGLRIVSAPEPYFAFLGSLSPDRFESPPPGRRAMPPPGPGTAQADPAEPTGARRHRVRRHRVRVKQIGGSRSRTLVVSGDSAEEAERAAMAELGEGWKVLAVESVSG
jgi:hypothetical protein